MCVFDRERGSMTVVTDLLQGRHDFPIPIQEDFGGDVIVGWRSWTLSGVSRRLLSPTMACTWTPGEPMAATYRGDNGEVSVPAFGPMGISRGIYCGGSRDEAQGKGYTIFGEVALWGTVLDFRGGKKEGAVGQYAYPLSLYAPRRYFPALVEWAATGVEIYDLNGVRADLPKVGKGMS